MGDLNKFQADLMETEKMRGINKTEVRGIEDRLKNLGEEVMKKVCGGGEIGGGGGEEGRGERESE